MQTHNRGCICHSLTSIWGLSQMASAFVHPLFICNTIDGPYPSYQRIHAANYPLVLLYVLAGIVAYDPISPKPGQRFLP